jgi:hypothetical protein
LPVGPLKPELTEIMNPQSTCSYADKLWRYTKEGFEIDIARFGETGPEGLARLEAHIENWFLTASGGKYAQALFHQRAQEMLSEAQGERKKDG